MSDQPKPFVCPCHGYRYQSRECCLHIDESQPKPTGEWTADSDGVLLPMHRFVGQYAKEIADAHNAALAQAKEGK